MARFRMTKLDMGTYPEILEDIEFYKQFKQNMTIIFYSFEDVEEFLKNNRDYQVYTEIDGDDDRIYLDRGFHLCNRTGVWVCVKDEKYKVMEYVLN